MRFALAIVALATAGQAKINERLNLIKQEKLNPYFESIKFDVADKNAMYEATINELRVDPSDVTIVDDRVIRGIGFGNEHGCRTVWIQNGKFSDELPTEATGTPDHTVTSVGDLQSIL